MKKEQLQKLIKEEIQKLNEDFIDMHEYPREIREIISDAYGNDLLSFSNDAAVESGKGFYVPAEKLVQFIDFVIRNY